jgi:hypothetical protein
VNTLHKGDDDDDDDNNNNKFLFNNMLSQEASDPYQKQHNIQTQIGEHIVTGHGPQFESRTEVRKYQVIKWLFGH